jgi:hypothetical protein
MVEADVMDETDEIMEDQNLRHEDAYDYDGIAIEVGGAEPQDQWDPLSFY